MAVQRDTFRDGLRRAARAVKKFRAQDRRAERRGCILPKAWLHLPHAKQHRR